jgi:hypothetical protein
MYKIQPIQHGHFVFQSTTEEPKPIMVAWFQEDFDAEHWVEVNKHVGVTLTIVPFSLPEPQMVRIPYTSEFVAVPYGKTLADVLVEVGQ